MINRKTKKKSISIFGDDKTAYGSFIYKGKDSNIFLESSSKNDLGIGESKFMQLPNVSIIQKSENNSKNFLDFNKNGEESFLNKLDMIYAEDTNSKTAGKDFFEEENFFNELNNIDSEKNNNNTKKSSNIFTRIDTDIFQKNFNIRDAKSYKKSDIQEKGFGVFFE